MTSYVPVDLRRWVESRARGACEYCLIDESNTFLGCQVDHVISEKHGGETVSENLCIACTVCNRAKGSDIASLIGNGTLVRLFNPRVDRWSDHFRLEEDTIVPLTQIGEVTATLLNFNDLERILERAELISKGRYPPFTRPAP